MNKRRGGRKRLGNAPEIRLQQLIPDAIFTSEKKETLDTIGRAPVLDRPILLTNQPPLTYYVSGIAARRGRGR